MISRRALGFAALALALLAFSGLGAWQLGRGQARQQYLDMLAAQAPQQERGEYLGDRQLLLDGQAHDGVPGYHVWTPLKISGGDVLIVDRGWVPTTAASIEAPRGEVTIGGFWRPLPRPGIRLQGPPQPCPAAGFPLLVEYPDAAALGCALGAKVRDGVLQLEPAAPGGYVREWIPSGFPPARHYAYAAQWFGMALVAAVVMFRSRSKAK